MNPVEDYFFRQKEPYQSIMLYVRSVILKTLPNVNERYSYKIPFYTIGKKPMLYLNILKGKDYVDVAFVHGIVFEQDFPMLKNDNNRQQVRSIQLRSIEDMDEPQFVALLKRAALQTEANKKAWFLD